MVICGPVLIIRGIRGLADGAAYVTAGGMKSGPLSPLQAIIGGVGFLVIGFIAGRVAFKKKEPIQPPVPTRGKGT